MKSAKMANDHWYEPLCSNDKRYGSGKALSYFSFLRDKQKRKRTPPLEYTQVYCLCPSSLVSNPKWRLRDNGVYQGTLAVYRLQIEMFIRENGTQLVEKHPKVNGNNREDDWKGRRTIGDVCVHLSLSL